MMINPEQDILPPGVGRLPQWWMEITPHYVLDLEEEEFRRRTEEQMAYYYAQMAAAADAGMLDANGQPILGPDGKPRGSWGGGNGWAGRSSSGGSNDGGQDGPLGRSFVPGQVTPETLALLGIDANSDPNYRSYLTGAKYPPGYWEKLAELGYTGPGISANNLAQTDFGRYGRQAEQPKHQPSWAKMKLRSTSHGQDIRHGIYDSPKNTKSNRVVDEDSTAKQQPMLALVAPPLVDESTGAPPTQEVPPPKPKQKRIVRKVRKVLRSKKQESPAPEAAPAPVASTSPAAPKPISAQVTPPKQAPHRNFTHNDYYYNAPASNTYAGMSQQQRQQQSAAPAQPQPLPEQAPAPSEKPPVAAPQHSSLEDDHSDEYEEEIIEEIIDDEEYEEVIEYYDDEEEVAGDDDDITDLQAILAAKQAELARLQAQLSHG